MQCLPALQQIACEKCGFNHKKKTAAWFLMLVGIRLPYRLRHQHLITGKPMKPPKTHVHHETGIPFITLFIGTAAFLLFFGDSAPYLQYNRAAIANGELWRFVTSHLTHWSFNHLLWCTITFVSLGCICERLSRTGFVTTLLVSSFIIPLVSWLVEPGMDFYRGLSGLASSIFVFGAGIMLCENYVHRNWPEFILAAVAGLAFSGKIIFEFVSGNALFVNTEELFAPAPLAHITGGIIGLLMVILFTPQSNNQSG